jgi:hypothetical protein
LVIVIAATAADSEPVANAPCSSNNPMSVDAARLYPGQSTAVAATPRCTRSSMVSFIRTALKAKQSPAATETSVACTRAGRPAAASTSSSTSTAVANPAMITRARFASPSTGATSRTTRNSTTPPVTAPTPNHSSRLGQRRAHAVDSGIAKSNCVTSSGCTSATEPRCRASAWIRNPSRLVNQPTSHSGLRTNLRTSAISGRNTARPASSSAVLVAVTVRRAACC